ncbi:hypothetical protein [Kocuria palustris]|uniref:hypothetical protein n=1 Tax=Kocuria palustris TaxID=71999 RepID=UPI0035DE561B
MDNVYLCVEEYIDGEWGPDPDRRPTDLPPLQVKDHKQWDAEGWRHRGDTQGYVGAYKEFADKVVAAFNSFASPDETLIVEADPLVTFFHGDRTDFENKHLQQAIAQVGLPTRADVEAHSDWGE